MILLVIAVLSGLVALGVAWEWHRGRAEQAGYDRERQRSHERLMREVQGHAADDR